MPLIGIIGKTGSGKDTAASYLANKFEQEGKEVKITRFAIALKRIVSVLLDCEVDLLEDQVFKSTPLPNWIVYRYTNRLTGKVLILDGPDTKHPPFLFKFEKEMLTPRRMLQIIGTDLFRSQFHPSVWIKTALDKYNSKDSLILIIADTRFKEEVRAIYSRSGFLLKVVRPFKDRLDYVRKLNPTLNRGELDRMMNHESETSLDDATDLIPVRIIEANTLEDLHIQLDSFYKSIKKHL